MPEKSSGKPSDARTGQSKKFIDVAREHGCDEDEAAFDAKLKKIASAPLPKKPKPNDTQGTAKLKKGD